MADPLSIVANIVAVAGFAERIVRSICSFVSAVKDSPNELRDLIREVSILGGLLFGLKTALEAYSDEDTPRAHGLASRLGRPLEECTLVLTETETLLAGIKSLAGLSLKRVARSLLSHTHKSSKDSPTTASADLGIAVKLLLLPEKMKEFAELLAKLERCKSMLTLALVTDELATIYNIEDCLTGIHDKIAVVLSEQERLKVEEAEKARHKRLGIICEWLSPVNIQSINSTHRSASETRQPTAGQWLVESENFQKWLKKDSQLFWLSGIAGAGKTILTSRVIDYVSDYCQNTTDHALAYFYCDFNLTERRKSINILGALLASLLYKNKAVDDMFENFYAECNLGSSSTSEKLQVFRMMKLLVAISEHHYQLIIVVDGLDECSEAGAIASRLLRFTKRSKNLKVFVSSREHEVIKIALTDCVHIHIEPELITDDVEQYIQIVLDGKTKNGLLSLDAGLKRKIKNSVVHGTRGMFQWAKCQIEHILNLPNRKAIDNALDELPPDLDATYDRILQNIYDMGEENQKLANKTFHLLAVISVQVQEGLLLQALSVEEGDAELDTYRMCTPETLLNICKGLIRLKGYDSGERSFEISHYSVLEYLQSEKCRNAESVASTFHIDLQKAYALISTLCLTVLSFDAFEDSLDGSGELSEPPEESPLFEWATLSWASYALKTTAEDRPVDMLNAFLGSDCQEHFSCWAHKYASLTCCEEPEEADIPNCLVYASMFGLNELVSGLLEEGHNINAIDEEFGSPLIAAISEGHVGLVECLIGYSADLNRAFGRVGTPLQAAVLARNREIIETLLSNGASVNAVGGAHGTPLQAAIFLGDEWAVDRLMKEGADIETEGYGDFWITDVEGEGEGEVGENEGERGGSFRIESEEMETSGHTNDGNLGHPLLVASMRGHERIVTKLVKAGANVNRVSGGYGTAICAAAAEGHIRIVRRLLRASADINIQAGCYGTALQAATARSNQTIVKILLDSGADVNARGPYFGTALDAANEAGNQTVRALLLDYGADPTITGTLKPPAKLFQESEFKQLCDRPWEGRFFYNTSLIPTESDDISGDPTAASNSGIINFNFEITPILGVDRYLGIFSRGADAIGTWDIKGALLENGRVVFLKSYDDYEDLRWQYKGHIFLEPEVCMGGTWREGDESGTFLLRPRRTEDNEGPGISSGTTWNMKAPTRVQTSRF
ncbi:hypothetical protein L873DRAFT_1848059 [Choiromyces venosus 120613-1]|uniref:Nephrocystin 3-like N-terminal domain-containing protein n=1 Tax=Choiromyces venosus 120613-1 TaxID=1336337 RepID=A0A3N4J5K4_9PEZI|nr:hypothetical protein L873DRAFT_1848059 [Choiromyces venosus 120613-1]